MWKGWAQLTSGNQTNAAQTLNGFDIYETWNEHYETARWVLVSVNSLSNTIWSDAEKDINSVNFLLYRARKRVNTRPLVRKVLNRRAILQSIVKVANLLLPTFLFRWSAWRKLQTQPLSASNEPVCSWTRHKNWATDSEIRSLAITISSQRFPWSRSGFDRLVDWLHKKPLNLSDRIDAFARDILNWNWTSNQEAVRLSPGRLSYKRFCFSFRDLHAIFSETKILNL